MSSGNWTNNDGLYLQFGTSKATPETFGDYQMWGPNRIIEGTLDLSTQTTAAGIISNTLFFPEGQGIFIEKVELTAEQPVSTTGSPTISFGLIQDDRSTVPSNGGTAFVAAVSATSLAATGTMLTMTAGTSGAGGFVGKYNTQYNTNTSGTNSVGGYLTCTLGTTTATGIVRLRVYYHGVGTIQY